MSSGTTADPIQPGVPVAKIMTKEGVDALVSYMRKLPREYGHEPTLGLAAGADGLDSVRAIFAAARQHLRDDGILVVEVGNTERALVRSFPKLPFVWPHIARWTFLLI